MVVPWGSREFKRRLSGVSRRFKGFQESSRGLQRVIEGSLRRSSGFQGGCSIAFHERSKEFQEVSGAVQVV